MELNKKLRVLIFEDNLSDAELIKRQLLKLGMDFEAQVAPDRSSFASALEEFAPDIILADYSVPGFDGMAAFDLARKIFADIPVIIVSGVIGEDLAVEALKAGATDYVLKNNLARLAPAVSRAIDETTQLAEKKSIEAVNSRLFGELKEIAELNRTLNEINGIIHSTFNMRRVMQKVLREAVKAIGCEVGSISLREGSHWVRVALCGLPKEILGERLTGWQKKMAASVAETRKPVIMNNPRDDGGSFSAEHGTTPSMALPISSRNKVGGVIFFDRPSDPLPFGQSRVDFAVKLAASLSLALENARLYEEERQAKRLGDALNNINAAISSIFQVDKIMETVTRESARAIGSESAAIFVRDGDFWRLEHLFGYLREHSPELRGLAFTAEQVQAEALAAQIERPIVIHDARNDHRLSPLLVEKFEARSVLAVPLTARGQINNELVFVYHTAPVIFTDAQIDFAQKLAAAVSLAVENIRLFEREHEIAETVQEALLMMPETLSDVAFGHLYESATETAKVGGDFYDLFELEPGRVGVVIGDVAGKGLQAAAVATLVKDAIKVYAFDGELPAGVMSKANSVIIKNTPMTMFVTAFFGILDRASGRLTYCCAGHPPAYILETDGTVAEMESGAPVVGVFPDADYGDESLILKPGDRLVLYTDGITEARRNGEFFGESGIKQLIEKSAGLPAEKLPLAIFQDVSDYTGGALADDVALLVVSLKI
ncbi:MAG: SpoIIE family protein phosphatase [Armatimonadetes bacterium]|nr:SpoIIE family protein phosphatase [Armatimonadota bacterium]